MQNRTRIAASLVLLLTAICARGSERVVMGQTFPIDEPDVLGEIQQRAGSTDWKTWMVRKPAEYSAFKTASLPRALKDSSRLFDPTYVLPEAIVDQNGKVLFPKGMRVNVYERIKAPGRFIVIGPSDADFEWLQNVAKPVPGDKVLLSGGNALEVRQSRRMTLFALDDRFIERFGLKAVPSIAQQEGNRLRVTEYAIR